MGTISKLELVHLCKASPEPSEVSGAELVCELWENQQRGNMGTISQLELVHLEGVVGLWAERQDECGQPLVVRAVREGGRDCGHASDSLSMNSHRRNRSSGR